MAIFYLYEIKNNINQKIYIGVHSTNNINDDYMGSGTLISKAIKKYGKQNFTKTILQYFDTEEEMYEKESEIVNEKFVRLESNYNVMVGGYGSWTKSNEIIKEKKQLDFEWEKRKNINISIGIKKAINEGKCVCATKEFMKKRNELSHTPEAKLKRKETYKKINYQQKENHNLYGKRIVHKPNENWIWIKEEELEQYLNQGWLRGRSKKISLEA